MTESLKKYFIGIVCMLVAGVVSYYVLTSLFTLPNFFFIKILGLAIVLFGIILSAVEEKDKLDFFYGASQTGGSNANSYVIVAVGTALALSKFSILIFTLGLIISIVIVISVRLVIAKKMDKNM